MKRFITVSFFFLLLSFPMISFSQISNESLLKLEEKLDSVIQSEMEDQQIPGLAYIIIEGNKVMLKKGYGLPSFENGIGFLDPDSSIIRIGSITKTFTSMALLQLADHNQIDLHADVNKYLTSLKVPDTFEKPITAAHLMNHSAGLDELPGRLVFSEEELIPLSEFLEERLVRLREPGTFTSYSTYGIALAGLLVEDISDMSLESYFQKNIWEPLGMSMTSITLSSEHDKYVSPGYELEDGVNDPQPWEWYHTYPASSINSTVSDMKNYIIMHLNSGSYNGNSVLSKKSVKAMQSRQLSMHPEVPGFAFGFYEDIINGLLTFGHGGDMLGYSSFLSLVPEKDIGIYVVNHHEGTRLRFSVLSTIMQHLNPDAEINTSPVLKDSDISRFTGNYRWSTYCHSCTESYQPNPMELNVDPDEGTISAFGRIFYQVEPLLLKSQDGSMMMGFVEDEKGNIKYMSIGNSSTFEKID